MTTTALNRYAAAVALEQAENQARELRQAQRITAHDGNRVQDASRAWTAANTAPQQRKAS